VTGLIAAGFFVVLTVMLVLGFVVAAFVAPPVATAFRALLSTGGVDNSSPVVLAFSLGAVAILLPSLWLAQTIAEPSVSELSVAGSVEAPAP
jgi:hypothetical protein